MARSTFSTFKSIANYDSKEETRFVVFKLGMEKFGAHIEHVKEVLTVDHIIAIPRAPEYVLGVINLRGALCTVIDLPRRLAVRRVESEELPPLDNRNVVIVEVGKTWIGMAVDQVESITSIPFSIIETQLDMVKKEIHAPFLEGIAKITEDELIILLNLDVVFSEYEVEELLDMAERKIDGESDLDGEFVVSKEDLERLDLVHDDIDAISTKSSVKDVKIEPSTPEKVEDNAPREDLSKKNLEKKTKDELVRIATGLDIENPKAKKKAELVELLTQSSKVE
ncbi:MAG: chemotaxis protein CheW [Candidatus Hodarchaeales archaeon]|jgi:purine-binding chemotaxis protein CheW